MQAKWNRLCRKRDKLKKLDKIEDEPVTYEPVTCPWIGDRISTWYNFMYEWYAYFANNICYREDILK